MALGGQRHGGQDYHDAFRAEEQSRKTWLPTVMVSYYFADWNVLLHWAAARAS